MAIEQTIAVTTHGRYLVEPAAAGAPLLIGFHGYAEAADVQFERLRAIEGSHEWTLIAVQGLHRFYQRRTSDVVASWMTRQNREAAIADNRAYVAAVVDAEWRLRGSSIGVVFAGFSQGVAMAFRAAPATSHPVLGVVAVGGDVPPELDRERLARIPRVLLMRGAHDPLYPASTFEEDQRRLRDAGVALTAVEFDGGHEWSAGVLDESARFLRGTRR